MTPILKNLDHSENRRQAWMPQVAMRLLWPAFACSLVVILAASYVYGQAAAEYGSATSGMATSMSGINLMNKVKFPDTTQEKKSVILSQPSKDSKGNPNYILDSLKQGSVSANRKALEQHAGKNAAKLMLRSKPTNAYVKIDGKPVGRTPILLVVHPGQYDVTMDGARMDHAEQKIDLLPKETREFEIPLKQQYPTEVKVQLH